MALSKKTTAPLVSVLMPTYNAATFVKRAIDSMQAQTMTNWELLAVDDCSTDNTMDVVKALAKKDTRIRVLKTPKNGGPSVARNFGLEHARGKWIGLLDADDAYQPERLKTLTDAAKAHNLDMIADNILMYDAGADRIVRKGFQPTEALIPWTLEQHFLNNLPGRKFVYGWLKPLFNAEYLRRHKLRYDNTLRYGEDFLFYAENLHSGAKAGIVADGFYIYTLRVGELSAKSSGLSQTQVDVKQLIGGLEHFETKHAKRLTPAMRAAIRKTKSETLAFQDFTLFKHHLAKQPLKAFGIALRKPCVWRFLANTVVRKAGSFLRCCR